MKKYLYLSVVVMLFLVANMAHAAKKPVYVNAPPLDAVITTPVGEVSATGVTELPIITWPGEFPTIYANGNQNVTIPNSIFGREGLNYKIVREDRFKVQIEHYLSGKSPFLRCTLGMLNTAVEVLKRDPRTKPVIVYQLTWSANGDAFVVKSNIKTAKDLRGKTIVLQAYGPHIYYVAKILADAGLTINDVKIKWTEDLTGTDNTPVNAFENDPEVDAAFMLTIDALALIPNEKGAEGVKGARIFMTTKTANRIIADVYVVRSDYFESHRDEMQKFVHGLMIAEEAVKNLMANKGANKGDYKAFIGAAAKILLDLSDSPEAISNTEGMYGDCEFVGWKGNVKFFGDPNYPRNLNNLTKEIQTALISLGLISQKISIDHAKWDYNLFKIGLINTSGVEVPKFDVAKVAQAVAKKEAAGTLEEGKIFSFEIGFEPNKDNFTPELYKEQFREVIKLAATYGGAVITVEGHSDSLDYLKMKKGGASTLDLSQKKQAAKNLSLNRANRVVEAIIGYAKATGVTLDQSQFTTIGHGVMKPKHARLTPDGDPDKPKNEAEWKANMRVEFRILQMEAESSTFELL